MGASPSRRRPPELGRSPCRALLRFRDLPGGEALPAHGEMGLQGAGKGLDAGSRPVGAVAKLEAATFVLKFGVDMFTA